MKRFFLLIELATLRSMKARYDETWFIHFFGSTQMVKISCLKPDPEEGGVPTHVLEMDINLSNRESIADAITILQNWLL